MLASPVYGLFLDKWHLREPTPVNLILYTDIICRPKYVCFKAHIVTCFRNIFQLFQR